MSAMPQTWAPPLPLGWEARYHHQHRQYFYINHLTKTTQWEDPRYTHADASMNLATTSDVPLSQLDIQSPLDNDPPTEIVLHNLDINGHIQDPPAAAAAECETKLDNKQAAFEELQSQFPDCPYYILQNILFDKDNNMGDASTELALRGYRKVGGGGGGGGGSAANSLQLLKHTFPHVDKSLVFNIWMSSSQDKAKAESRLIQLGYRPVGNRSGSGGKSPYHTSSNTSPHRYQQKGHSSGSRENSPHNYANRNNVSNLSPHHTGSPSRSPRQLSPKRSYSPNKSSSSPKRSPSPSAYTAGPSEAEKERLYEKFVAQFPNQPTTVIAAALEVCCYNEMQTLAVLQASLDTNDRSEPKPVTPPAPVRQPDAKRSHPKTDNKPVSYDPVALSDRSDKSPSSSASSVRDMSSCKSPEDEDSPERISNMPSVIHDSPTKHPASQARAKQVTRLSEQLLSSTSDMLSHIANSCCIGGTAATVANLASCGITGDARTGNGNISTNPSTVGEGGGDQKTAGTNSAVLNTINGNKDPLARMSNSDTVVTSEKQVYMSPYRLKAKGPDASLRHGPDDKNLLPSYLGVIGPNRQHYRGPDHSLARGPMKSQGPDAINRCGPLNSMQTQDPVLVTKL